MKTTIKTIAIILFVFGVIQLVPVDKTNPPVNPDDNFVEVNNTPKNITIILRKSCYDCHSNETVYPRYASVAPISWSVKHHVNKGREHLNFSIWRVYNPDLKRGMLKHIISEIEENRMPIKGYIAQHPDARLSAEEKLLLTEYFRTIMEK